MNENTFVKFFVEPGKFAEDDLSAQIVDEFPAIVCLFDANSRKLTYSNSKFKSFFGGSHRDPGTSDLFVSSVAREALKQPAAIDKEYHYFSCDLKDCGGIVHPMRIRASCLKKDGRSRSSILLFVLQHNNEDAPVAETKDDLQKLSEETETLLQFGSWTLFTGSGKMLWTPGLYLLMDEDSREASNANLDFYLRHVVNGFRDTLDELLKHAVTSGAAFELEYVLETKFGIRKTVFTKARPVFSADGKVEKIQGITRDITAVRQSELEQERSIRDLNRSNKELEEFAYVASHDLQEPLRKIAMFSERLKGKLGDALDQEGQFFLARIVAASNNMKVLIDDLLEFSRFNQAAAGNFQLVDLRSILEQATADLELKIDETNSKMTVHGNLPKIEGVAFALKQLFGNLLSNAIKFRKAGEPAKVDISFTRLSRDEKKLHQLSLFRVYHRITITDNGIGFEQENAEKIFQLFHRLHGKAEYPGTGIGLAICKKIVDNHNGVIFARSVPGEGTTFTVILPEKQ